MNLDEAINLYLRHLEVEKASSPATIQGYGRTLGNLRRYLATDGGKRRRPRTLRLASITIDDLRRFTASRMQTKRNNSKERLKNSTVGHDVYAVRSCFRWLLGQEFIKRNPAVRLEAPKAEKPLPSWLTVPEIDRLLDTPDRSTVDGLRDATLLLVTYCGGLRVSEVCGLGWSEIDFENGEVLVLQGKGQVDRIAPTGDEATTVLRDWRERQRAAGVESPVVFPGRGASGRITARHVARIVDDVAHKAAIGRPVHPHTLRHSAATHMLQNGADLRAVQEFLGHKSLRTTVRYTHIDIAFLKRNYDGKHPRSGEPPEGESGPDGNGALEWIARGYLKELGRLRPEPLPEGSATPIEPRPESPGGSSGEVTPR